MSKIIGPAFVWAVVIYLLYVLGLHFAKLGPSVWQKIESVFVVIVAVSLVVVAIFGTRRT